MAGPIVCPTCGKRFAFKPELAGKRLRCPACKEPFTVGEETRGDFDLAPDAPPDIPVTPPPLSRGPAGKAGRAPAYAPRGGSAAAAGGATREKFKLELTDRERAWLKFGLSMVGFGIVGIFLPMMGLKFKQVKDPQQQQAVAIGVACMGVVICGLVFLRRYFKYAMMAMGGVLALMIGGCSLLMMASRPGGCMSSRPAPPDFANRPPGPPVPGGVSGRPPGFPPPRTDGSGRSGPPTLESLTQTFGAERVARVRVPGGSDKDKDVIERVRAALKRMQAGTWTQGTRGGRIEFVAAPVADLDGLATALGYGPVATSIDRAERIVTLNVITATQPATTSPAK